MKVKEAEKITDSFTKTSKMPGLSYSLPAWACKTGAKLVKVSGSTCEGCYALKGCYVFKVVQDAQYRRLASIKHEHVQHLIKTMRAAAVELVGTLTSKI